MPKSVMPALDEALSLVSAGVECLADNREVIEGLIGPKQVDVAARLNAQYRALESLLEPLKDSLKVSALKSGDSGLAGPTGALIRGDNYQAIVRKVQKIVLNTQRIKDFLGKKLSQYQVKRDDLVITFDVRS